MVRTGRLLMAVFVAGLIPAGTARAGSLLDWFRYCHCPRPSYSPCPYLTPTAVRVKDCLCGQKLGVHAPDRHPEVPPTFAILPYPCPAADPADTIIERPTPPPESAFRYLGGGASPSPGGTTPPPSP